MKSKLKLLVGGLAVAMAATVVGWVGVSDATAEDGQSRVKAMNLVLDANFPDPDVVKIGDKYYGYATNNGKNLPVASADKPNGPWKIHKKDAMPKLGKWAATGRTWAPDVSKRSDGKYLLYYTARHKKLDIQCIGAAVANKPTGPFTDKRSKPLVCPSKDAGAIDASTFVHGKKHYMLYKTDANAIGKPPVLYLQQTSANGLKLTGKPAALLRNDRDAERGIIEAPVLVKQGKKFVLFYSAGEFGNNSYYTGYAVASKLTGKYVKKSPLLTTGSTGEKVKGPGGADVVARSGGGYDIFFHGHNGAKKRSMYRADLAWAGSRPVVTGNWTRFEAENGKVHDCKVRANAAAASGGKVVAKIDHKNSYVDIKVYAAKAGKHTVLVGYANGTNSKATHKLSVNSTAAATVSYPKTGWDNWKKASVGVDLKAGWNTLRLQKGKSYAEVDFLDLR